MKFFILFIAAILAGCSTVTIDYHMPTTAGLMPEVSGDIFAGNIGGHVHSNQDVEIGSASTSTLFGSSSTSVAVTPSETSGVGLGITGSFGLLNFLQLYGRISNESTAVLGIQIQALGSSTKEREDGYKLAFSAGVGTGSETESKYEWNDTETDSSQADLSGETEMKSYEFGMQTGYRFNKYLMPYMSYHYSKFDVDGKLNVDGTDYFLQNEAFIQSTNLGLVFTTSNRFAFELRAEVGYAWGQVKGSLDPNFDQLSVYIGPSFRF